MSRRIKRLAPKIYKYATKAELTACLQMWCDYLNLCAKDARAVRPQVKLVGIINPKYNHRFWVDTDCWSVK